MTTTTTVVTWQPRYCADCRPPEDDDGQDDLLDFVEHLDDTGESASELLAGGWTSGCFAVHEVAVCHDCRRHFIVWTDD